MVTSRSLNLLLMPRSLDLSSNQLLAVPPWLPPGLTSLFMANNTLASIPEWAATRLMDLQVGLRGSSGSGMDSSWKEADRPQGAGLRGG